MTQPVVVADRFEYATARDPSLNYCLWQYQPVAPAEDKFRAVNLLFQSFDLAGLDPRAYEVVELIREGIGPFRTVFGIKQLGDGSQQPRARLGWEFYFYDYARRDRKVSITRLLHAIRPLVSSPIRVNENLPYFMFSIDVDGALVTGGRELDVVHMYVGNPGSTVSSGIAYALGRERTRLENFYFFFDARTMLRDAAEKIYCSAYVDAGRIDIDRILWPELRTCQTICVANKQGNDCVYFSGIDVDQLLHFLERLDYPKEIVGFVREHRSQLDHLLYDVGIDYQTDGDEIRVLKSGYYGVF